VLVPHFQGLVLRSRPYSLAIYKREEKAKRRSRLLLEAIFNFVVNMELPVLSLSHFTSGSESERNDFTRELIDSFKATGFVTLINHGFSDEMIQELFFRVRLMARLQGDQY